MRRANGVIIFLGCVCGVLYFTGCRTPYLTKDAHKAESRIRELSAQNSSMVLEKSSSTQDGAEGAFDPSSIRRKGNGALLTPLLGELTHEECIKIALLYNIELIKQELELYKAGCEIRLAYQSVFPKFDLKADANTLTPYNDSDKESYDIKLMLTQPLWRGGAISSAYRYANYEYEKTRLTLWKQRDSVLHSVSSLYYEILLKQELVKVYQSAVDVSERLYNTTKSKFDGGTVSQYDVLRAEVEVANSKAELLREENELSELKLSIYNLMGVSESSNVTFVGELAIDEIPIDTSKANAFALNNRIELLIAMCDIEKARENINIIMAENRPQIDLYASGGYGNSRGAASDWEDEWQLGISATLRLDDISNYAKRTIARTEQKQAQAELRIQEKKVLSETANAIMQMSYAEQYYQSQKKNKALSEEVLRMVEEGFKVGKNTQIEVLDARSALTEAVGGYYKSIYTMKQAHLNYNLAIGNINAESLNLKY
ncbi:MAG: TolC family protein [Kiritimatiellae bacterium]|nr:TolC family protein [Kiritimatiellia bacterium]